ncbi:MAG: prephenate dehydratase [Cyanobacteria bacterium]|nr:prephenate dehydratase [Cyanobacteria bacterium CG_2015-16_32_12]NCO77178.1 prephenate dehydratase [Cyanobacteria bacterium CG_2015-22_32_23]NCQ03651.1 prephenate dehydratase [Cyanobacteria bacterium CG_2015-09_32_10]NCQ40783.1 prephenate dehydratase [Cyanobacteria bacterium CG_2015-04_32_10]NCS84648.1 prephenate dehydratase [Cyanobacteria bacterium CG_2015-02_32_10]
MTKIIAHLGPKGTYSEVATLFYAQHLQQKMGIKSELLPIPSISQTLRTLVNGKADIAVVPVENSIEGTVAMTLDTLWELEGLHIQQAITIPIVHNLLSKATSISDIKTIYSHPQALAQCQKWLENNLPDAILIPSNSTTEALHHLNHEPSVGAIASSRAAHLYDLPIKKENINDYPDNCTRFWIVRREPHEDGNNISLGFAFQANTPGVLVKPLQIFADKQINLTKIESRPTKRSLGEYLFFVDLAGDTSGETIQSALQELAKVTKVLKVLGNYDIIKIDHQEISQF